MKNKKKIIIILCIIIGLLTAPVAFAYIYFEMKFSQVTDTEVIDKDDLHINTELEDMKSESVNRMSTTNIALFGVDCRTDNYDNCRSDVMMVLSYGANQNKAMITSLVRDSYVDILDYGLDKLNHAYAYGGPSKAIQTINRNFDMDIENYVTVNFWAVESIIDVIGGVEIDVSPQEFPFVNKWLAELNEFDTSGKSVKGITSAGLQTLNGRQAVAYMRIRSIGNGDFERMERQREVMLTAVEKVQDLNVFKLMELVDEVLPYIKTNLSKTTIVDMVMNIVKSGIPVVDQTQLPSANHAYGGTINSIYYFVPSTLIDTVTEWHQLIYDEETYQPTETVVEISNRIY